MLSALLTLDSCVGFSFSTTHSSDAPDTAVNGPRLLPTVSVSGLGGCTFLLKCIVVTVPSSVLVFHARPSARRMIMRYVEIC